MMAILYSETNLLCIMLLIFICLKLKSGSFLQTRLHLFRVVLLTNTFFFMLDMLWVFVDGKNITVSTAANWILNILYYIMSGVVSYCWFLYSETVQMSRLVRNRKNKIICAVPIMFLTVLTFASIKFGWLFYIDAANTYHRGPLYPLQLLICAGYVIFTAAKALILAHDTASYTQKTEYRTLACFVVAPLLCGCLQIFLPGIALQCVGTTFGCFYVFITIQDQMISEDPLTGINNRNKMMQYLSERIVRKEGEMNLFLLMMDLDYFKAINDEYGHLEGDNALRIVADGLKTCCKNSHYFIARYGGDEFAAVCELKNDESIEDFVGIIGKTLQSKSKDRPYKLSISIGWVKFDSHIKSEQDFIKLADTELYKKKRARKSLQNADNT
ncbi:GGDEF domain-containing protein [Treponema brennaborense]|uniref:diguanylate cyclase n=1 Tax=Treponema brennaborense (strain DSM 12168 / CIP 105900 / DD5/3) TaxID=906968 RepID=F4LJ73_TREBD|nr:GGDEF domain-containing protein [Treponema brennaborense]AEE16330.1 diguanylate cyclase [Treponema brennaborense DSM 12168]